MEDRVEKKYRLPTDLVEWYDEEADRQAISGNQLVTNALRFYRRNREAAE